MTAVASLTAFVISAFALRWACCCSRENCCLSVASKLATRRFSSASTRCLTESTADGAIGDRQYGQSSWIEPIWRWPACPFGRNVEVRVGIAGNPVYSVEIPHLWGFTLD